jgi:hypothetical protein
MKNLIITLLALLLSVAAAQAQFARVQVIHNSPNAAVDVYVSGSLTLDNFPFRTATQFIDLPAGIPIPVAIALSNSSSAGDAFFTTNLTLEDGKTYAVTASGIAGNPTTPFTLIVDDQAREEASTPAKVAVSVMHGSPDAPAVDVVVRTGDKIVSNIAYGEFTPYLEVDPGVYYLDIKPAGQNTIVGTFRADLTTFVGDAVRVHASGLLNPPIGGAGFGLWAAWAGGQNVDFPSTPVARVQVIHNSPGQDVDVYVNGALTLDNFAYRTASPFVLVPAGFTNIGVALDNSLEVGDTLKNFQTTLVNGGTYVAVANGIVGDPNAPFELVINENGVEQASDTAKTDITFFHGGADAPNVDVDVIFEKNDYATNLAYGNFADSYLSVLPGKNDLTLRLAGTPNAVDTWRADLSDLKGKGVTVFASGFLSSPPEFGLFAVAPDGTVTELTATPFARLQVIHNSPDPTVDVYAGNVRLLDNFAFRTATPYIDVPADRSFAVGVAPDDSDSAADAIATFPVNLETDKTYAVFASGLVGGNPAFTLLADESREAALNPANVEFNVLHGSPDAPAVDVAIVGLGNVIENISYGNFSQYFSLAPASYQIQVKPAGSADVLDTYQADLGGLTGGAARVFASGLLNGTPGFGLFAALPNGTVIEFPRIPKPARLQVIHNSPAGTVDVYANGDLLLNDFEFRTATPFIDVPTGVNVDIAVAPGNSTSANDALATFPVVFEEDKTYVVTAAGLLNNPTTPFNLFINENGQEAALQNDEVDVAVFHGSTNAPAVDVDAVFVADNIVQNLAYGQYTPYLDVAPDKYDFAIRGAGTPGVLYSYRADLTNLAGRAATVFASGFVGGVPEFGLFAALADGSVVELPATPTARVQIIHNAPDPTVDVYAGNTLLIDDFAFRTATAYVTIPADRTFTVGVAGGGSTSPDDILFPTPVSFETGKTYAVFANGIPNDPNTPFTLLADESRETALDPTKVEFATLHGSPGAPAVDVSAIGVGNLITNLAYGEFSPYLAVNPSNYILQVKVAGTNTSVGFFQADLGPLAGNSARVFASGIVGGLPKFGLFAVLADGSVVEFPEVAAPATARLQVIHNSPSPTVDVYVNGDLLLDDFEFRTATPFIDVLANTALSIAVAPGNSTSVNDAVATFPVQFEDGQTYIATASGILGDLTTPFTLIVNTNARESAITPDFVDIAVLHGSPGAPAVDVDAVFVADNVIENLAYGQFTPYFIFEPDVYDLAVRATGNPDVVASYRADISGLTGGAAYVFASGILGGTPAFGLFAALPNGTVIELPLTPTTRVQIVHNSPAPTVDVYVGNTLLLDDFSYRTATPFVDIPADRNLEVGVAPENSTSAADAIATFPVSFDSGKVYSVTAAGIVGDPLKPFNLFVDANARETVAPGFTSISTFHGLYAPFTLGIDVNERLIGNLFDNVDFGAYTPYLDLANGEYYLDVTLANFDDLLGTHRIDPDIFSDKPARIFTSGIVGSDSLNYNVFAVFPDGSVVDLPNTPVARVQIVHNAPEPTVDVYAGDALILDDFEFRTATPFIYAPAEVQIDFGVAPGNSTSVNDVIATFPVTFESRKTYLVFASGLVGGSPGFELIVNDMGRERALDDTKLELAIHHGSPGAPNVTVASALTGATVVPDLPYGDFTDYLSLDPDLYLFDIAPTANPNQLVGTWGGDFSGAAGVTGVVFASGIVGDDPEFDLWLALPNGFTLPLPSFARAQVIHNSPSPTVDVYLDSTLAINNFQFRQATNFGFLPARAPFTLSVAPGNSTSVGDAIYELPVELETGKTYVITAAGVVGGSPGFGLFVNENARFRAVSGSDIDVALFHGSPDALEVDVQVPGGPVIFDNIEFGEYSDYVSLAPNNYIVEVTPADDNGTVVKSYKADFADLTGEAITLFASGYLGSQPAFQVWVAEADGTTYPLEETVSTNELDNKISDLQLSPNPTVADLFLRFDLSESESLRYGIRDVTGRLVQEGDFGTVNAGEFVQKLDVGQLPAGMYQMEILSDAGVKAMKFVVQN